jgi:hypothetical protein
MDFIQRILAAVAGYLAEPLSYVATKIVTVMYPTASYNEILTHSNSASDTAAGVMAAIIIAWALWTVWQIVNFVGGITIGLIWSEMKSR